MAAIHAIYPATEGEGVRIGTPQVFVRFQGCAVGCKNCDSKETWKFSAANELSIEQITKEVLSHKLGWASITGGDPLDPHHRSDTVALIKSLKQANQQVNIEVTGLAIDDEIFSLVDFISFDIKTPSTGVTPDMEIVQKFIVQFGKKAQIKLVVEDSQDFTFAYDCYAQCRDLANDLYWVITPAASSSSALSMQNFKWILGENQRLGGKFRVIGQQHKWVFGSARLV